MSQNTSDPFHYLWLSFFLLSTPLAIVAIYFYSYDRNTTAIINSYCVALSFYTLYFLPFLSPFVKGTFTQRLNLAQTNWILYLTCFTEIVVQIPHSLRAKFLHDHKGDIVEYPLFAYSLSDSRWASYSQDGNKTFSLPFEVDLINLNDGVLGVIVLTLWLIYTKQGGYRNAGKTVTTMLVLVTVFRDATLWRETVEYLWVHHREGYRFSTDDEDFRIHAILLLYGMNGIWLIAPILTLWWGLNVLEGIPVEENNALQRVKID